MSDGIMGGKSFSASDFNSLWENGSEVSTDDFITHLMGLDDSLTQEDAAKLADTFDSFSYGGRERDGLNDGMISQNEFQSILTLDGDSTTFTQEDISTAGLNSLNGDSLSQAITDDVNVQLWNNIIQAITDDVNVQLWNNIISSNALRRVSDAAEEGRESGSYSLSVAVGPGAPEVGPGAPEYNRQMFEDVLIASGTSPEDASNLISFLEQQGFQLDGSMDINKMVELAEGVQKELLALQEATELAAQQAETLATTMEIEENDPNNNAIVAWDGEQTVNAQDFLPSGPEGVEPEIQELVDQLKAEGVITDDMTDEEIMEALSNWVQENIGYETDAEGEGWANAIDTLLGGSGDCEDRAILIANMAVAAGVDSDKIHIAVDFSGEIGHTVVGLEQDDGSFQMYDLPDDTTQDPVISTASQDDFAFTFNHDSFNFGLDDDGNPITNQMAVMEDPNFEGSLFTASFNDAMNSIVNQIQTVSDLMEAEAGLLEADDSSELGAAEMTRIANQLSLYSQQINIMTGANKTFLDCLSSAGDDAKRAMQA
jgi:predicted transglutaminase-like cysteine proteinase